MNKYRFSRREFLQTTSRAAGATLTANAVLLNSEPLLASSPAVPASDRRRFGIVGVGMEGSNLLTTAIQLPGVECAAACDLYDGRHELAREIVGKPIPTTRHYKELLDNKEIDAIIVAVPDHWHKQVVIDGVAAGKDVYCEKPFSHTPADGLALVEAATKSDRIVMVGAQRTSSVLCAKAKELYDRGAIGTLSLVEATLGRNDPTGAWEYPPPPDLSPENLDWDTWQGTAPKKPFDPLAFARWRCWKEYGTGVAGDLLVHLISGMQTVLGINEIPKRVSAFGGIYRWKDGRDMPDVHQRSFRIRQCAGLHASKLGYGIHRSYSLYGLQRHHRTYGVWRQLFSATGRGSLSELLHGVLSRPSENTLSYALASGTRSQTRTGAGS